MLKDIIIFAVHWYHAAGFLLVLGYMFRSGWNSLGATEQLARDAMRLSLDNPLRDEAIRAIDKAQRSAIFQMRMCLFFAIGILWIMLS